MRIDRYGDFFSGYFSQACARKLGDSVRVGTPIAMHARNSHNYLRDATQELACIGVLEDLLPWLQGVQLDGSDYLDAYVEPPVGRIRRTLQRLHPDHRNPQLFSYTAQVMHEWAKDCRGIGG